MSGFPRIRARAVAAIAAAVLFAPAAEPALRPSDAAHAEAIRPRVTGVDLYVEQGVLTGTLYLADIFSEEVEGTLESGLPAVVDLVLVLRTERGREARRLSRRITLEHNVWTDEYTVLRADTTLSFSSFDAMRAAIERLAAVPLANISRLDADARYVIELVVAVRPLADTDEDLTGWIDEHVLGLSSRGWRERVLNVGDLARRFFSGADGPTVRSETFRTPSFVPASLKKRGDAGSAQPLRLAWIRRRPALHPPGGPVRGEAR